MKLEDQVANLELSKKLKELGYPQEGLFWWVYDKDLNFTSPVYCEEYPGLNPAMWKPQEPPVPYKDEEFLAVASTVVELGEWLPTWCFTVKTKNDYYCWASSEEAEYANAISEKLEDEGTGILDDIEPIHGETEADARAKMLIWLVQEGYVKFN